MALSGKNISGYSKIEQQNFSSASFTDSGAQIFDGTEVVNIMEQISATLNSISNEYDAIRKGYNKCLNDTVSGKNMSADNADGKKIRQFKNKADKRADYVKQRKSSLQSEISTLKLMLELLNSENDSAQDQATGSDDISNSD